MLLGYRFLKKQVFELMIILFACNLAGLSFQLSIFNFLLVLAIFCISQKQSRVTLSVHCALQVLQKFH